MMSNEPCPFDYEDYQESDAPSASGIERIDVLVSEQLEAEQEVERITEELKEAKKRLEQVANKDLPDLMETLNLTMFQTKSGFTIKIKEDLRHSLPKSRKATGLAWLKDNQCGDIIKNVVSVPFVVGQEEKAQELLEQLRTMYGPMASLDGDVASQTLKATLKRLLDEGTVEVPFDLFGIVKQKTAKIN